MSLRRIAASVGVLVLTGAAAAGTVALLPREPELIETTPVEAVNAAPSVVCTGGFERTFEQGIDVSTVSEDITEQAWAVVSGTEAKLSHDGEAEPLDRVGALSVLLREGSLLGTLSSQDAGEESAPLAGASVHTADGGDTRGLASNPCVAPSVDQWFVGSASAVGVTNQLILSNPGHTSVVVRIAAHGSAGPLSMGPSGTVVVAPSTTERIDLDGVIPSDSRIALHVTTDSGTVAATMQINELKGVKPQGVSFISGGSSGTSVTIPGILISDDDAIPSVRLVNTEEGEARVSVELVGSDGVAELPGGSDVAVAPGAVLDLSLAGVDSGEYSLRVHSEQRVAAGVLLHTEATASGEQDMAWASAQRPISSGAVMFGEAAANLVLTTAGGDGSSVEVTPIAADGTTSEPQQVVIDGEGSASLALPDGSVGALVNATEPFGAAVVTRSKLAGGDGIDWVPVFTPVQDESTRRVTAIN